MYYQKVALIVLVIVVGYLSVSPVQAQTGALEPALEAQLIFLQDELLKLQERMVKSATNAAYTSSQQILTNSKFVVKKVPQNTIFDLSSNNNTLPVVISIKPFVTDPQNVSFCTTLIDKNNVALSETDCSPLSEYKSINTVLKYGDLSLAPLNYPRGYMQDILDGKRVYAKLRFELLNTRTSDYSVGFTRTKHPEYLLAQDDTGLFELVVSNRNGNPREQKIIDEADMVIKSNINNFRAAAEIVGTRPDGSINFSVVCQDSFAEKFIRTIDKEKNSGKVFCQATKEQWILTTEFKKPKSIYCVDSTGFSGTIKNVPKNSLSCSAEAASKNVKLDSREMAMRFFSDVSNIMDAVLALQQAPDLPINLTDHSFFEFADKAEVLRQNALEAYRDGKYSSIKPLMKKALKQIKLADAAYKKAIKELKYPVYEL